MHRGVGLRVNRTGWRWGTTGAVRWSRGGVWNGAGLDQADIVRGGEDEIGADFVGGWFMNRPGADQAGGGDEEILGLVIFDVEVADPTLQVCRV